MMTNLHLFLLLCGFIFFLIILTLLFRHRISEKYSILWLTAGIGILTLSSNIKILDGMARWVGVSYPPSLLFLLSTLILLGFHLYQSMEITKLNKKIKEITQYVALRHAEENLPKPELMEKEEYSHFYD
ncbi:MAG: DUF2304 domain-containing protein [Bacillota bacterium]|nr:DUF2304 domain-containing protein [Bacillota bacterium]